MAATSKSRAAAHSDPVPDAYSFGGLPASEPMLFELAALLRATPLPLAALVRVIRQEPALTAAVLRAAAAETCDETGILENCVILLGAKRLHEVVTAIPTLRVGETETSAAALAIASARLRAALAERIAIACAMPSAEEAFVAALLSRANEVAEAWRQHAVRRRTHSLPHRLSPARRAAIATACSQGLPCWATVAMPGVVAPRAARRDALLVRAVALACSAADALQRADRSGRPGNEVDCFELVRTQLPLLPLQRQAELARDMVNDFRRWKHADDLALRTVEEVSRPGAIHE